MKINKNNYEIYILGHYEGTLSDSEERELQSFLLNNPDLKEEFDGFENISITPDTDVKFDLKLALKKTPATTTELINDTNYKDYFIASIEGDLDTKQQKQLQVFLNNNPTLNEEYFLFTLTKLKPDTSIVFENKKQLKKYTIGLPNINRKAIVRAVSIAASFLVLFSVAMLYRNINISDTGTLSDNMTTTPQKVVERNMASIIDIPIKRRSVKPTIIKTNKAIITPKKELAKRENIEITTVVPKNQTNIELASNTINIDIETRDYYTKVNNMLIANETNQVAKKKSTPKNNPFNNITLPNEQLEGFQDFFYNVANRGYARIETISSGVKNAYRNIEQKLATK